MTTANVRRWTRVMSIPRVLAATGVVAAAAFIATASAADPPQITISPNDELLRWPVGYSKKVELTAPIDGIVSGVNVEEMALVKTDTVLAQMDDELQRVQVQVTELDVEHKAALRDEAQEQFNTMKALVTRGGGEAFELRQANLKLVSAQLAVQAAEQQLKLEQVKLTRYQIKAPFGGEVPRIEAEKGARLGQGDVAMTLASRDPLEAQMNLPVPLMNQLQIGRAYNFMAEDPVNRPVMGKLKTLEQQIDPASGTFRCVFTFDNPDLKLPAGFMVRLVWPQNQAAEAGDEGSDAADQEPQQGKGQS